MKIENLKQLYIEQLQDLYSVEEQLVEALPKLADAASASELKNAFKEHLTQTKQHRDRVEQILKDLGEKSGGMTCKGMQGIIAEGEELLEEDMDQDTLDAALITAAQRAEHYEMAGYGTVRTYAQALGFDDAAEQLQAILDEEADTDEKLTQIAESHVNKEAIS